MIDDKGVEQPVHAARRVFLARGAAFVADWKKTRGRAPRADDFQAAAVEWLKDGICGGRSTRARERNDNEGVEGAPAALRNGLSRRIRGRVYGEGLGGP